ncbi:hypothetical protein ACWG0P_15510 [Amedibacillus sp. YH-ame6]
MEEEVDFVCYTITWMPPPEPATVTSAPEATTAPAIRHKPQTAAITIFFILTKLYQYH